VRLRWPSVASRKPSVMRHRYFVHPGGRVARRGHGRLQGTAGHPKAPGLGAAWWWSRGGRYKLRAKGRQRSTSWWRRRASPKRVETSPIQSLAFVLDVMFAGSGLFQRPSADRAGRSAPILSRAAHLLRERCRDFLRAQAMFGSASEQMVVGSLARSSRAAWEDCR